MGEIEYEKNYAVSFGGMDIMKGMTSGITKHYQNNSTTHSYKGFNSICGSENITWPVPSSYSIRTRVEVSHCKTCKKMLKTKKIHDSMERRTKVMVKAQENAKKYGISLQDMLLTRLSIEVNMSMEISKMSEIFNAEYPNIDVEEVIVPLLVAGKVSILEGVISMPMETKYVK